MIRHCKERGRVYVHYSWYKIKFIMCVFVTKVPAIIMISFFYSLFVLLHGEVPRFTYPKKKGFTFHGFCWFMKMNVLYFRSKGPEKTNKLSLSLMPTLPTLVPKHSLSCVWLGSRGEVYIHDRSTKARTQGHQGDEKCLSWKICQRSLQFGNRSVLVGVLVEE